MYLNVLLLNENFYKWILGVTSVYNSLRDIEQIKYNIKGGKDFNIFIHFLRSFSSDLCNKTNWSRNVAFQPIFGIVLYKNVFDVVIVGCPLIITVISQIKRSKRKGSEKIIIHSFFNQKWPIVVFVCP